MIQEPYKRQSEGGNYVGGCTGNAYIFGGGGVSGEVQGPNLGGEQDLN